MPDWKRELRQKLSGLHLPPTRETEIVDELADHLENRYQELLASGASPREAKQCTLAELNENDQLATELRLIESREISIVSMPGSRFRLLTDLWLDVRHSARLLRKNPVFTLITLLTLALGIGANTAIFTLINSVMLRPLPVKNPQELVLFRVDGPLMPAAARYNFNYPLYEMFRDQTQSLSGVISANNVGRGRLVVNDGVSGGAAEPIQQQRVSGNFFSVLQVDAVMGRNFTEAEDNPANTQPGAVISYDYWQRRFGFDAKIVGRQISVNNTPLTIIGVAPPGFFGFDVGARPELWWPIKAIPDPNLQRTGSWWLRVIGRLRPGVTREQAQSEVDTIFKRQIDEEAANTNWTSTQQKRSHFERQATLEPGYAGYTSLRRQFRQPLFILMITVGLVLLIACVNIANLLLARAAARRKEIAVRLALGANRLRLIRQLLTESFLLSLLGGAASLFIAQLFVKALLSYLPPQSQSALDQLPDARVLGFTLVVSLLTALLFGLTPAWQATRLSLTDTLKTHTGASASSSLLTVNKLLVVTQVALSLFLLIGAGLFIRSLRNLRTLDAGMNYENIVQFSLDSGNGYNAQQRNDLYKRVLDRLETLPGVSSATLSYFSLLSGNAISFNIVAPEFSGGPDVNTECNAMAVGPRFFETMKMPILAGRDFGPQDERPISAAREIGGPQNLADAPPLYAVINQTMARFFYGDQNPIGKRFSQKGSGQQFEVIGVTHDAKYLNLREEQSRTYYVYYFQQPQRLGVTFQVRTTTEPADYAGTIQHIMKDIDPQVQVVGLQTMADVVDQSIMQERFVAQTASAFSVIALVLACIGLYGVMSHAVTRRTNEIGIRMALGARTNDVLRLVMREVALLVSLGAIIGLSAALATMRLVSNLLFGLTPTDPLTVTCATLVLLIVAALAGYLPARRASRVDPLIALRWE